MIIHNEPQILKKIATYLGINDKQSLMFALTEENLLEKEDSTILNSTDM